MRCALAQMPTGSESLHGVVAPQPVSRKIRARSASIFDMANGYMGSRSGVPERIRWHTGATLIRIVAHDAYVLPIENIRAAITIK